MVSRSVNVFHVNSKHSGDSLLRMIASQSANLKGLCNMASFPPAKLAVMVGDYCCKSFVLSCLWIISCVLLGRSATQLSQRFNRRPIFLYFCMLSGTPYRRLRCQPYSNPVSGVKVLVVAVLGTSRTLFLAVAQA